MRHSELRQQFYRQLSSHYLQGELQALYHWCVEEIEGWSRAVAYTRSEQEVSGSSLERWNEVIQRLQQQEPVQYVFEKAHFHGLELFVDRRVLIPRPETEELVTFVLKELQEAELHVLDVGTGSGAIALALKSERPSWEVSACDVSPEALYVAKRNGRELGVNVHWLELDVRDEKLSFSGFDVMVSNPPYIPSELKNTLDVRVERYEPALALFAPEDEPFYFFRRIAEVASDSDVQHVFFETHATDANHLENALREVWAGRVMTKTDVNGKARFVHLSR